MKQMVGNQFFNVWNSSFDNLILCHFTYIYIIHICILHIAELKNCHNLHICEVITIAYGYCNVCIFFKASAHLFVYFIF